MGRKKTLPGVFIAGLSLLSMCAAGTLETQFTSVVIKDVPIGRWTRVELDNGRRYSLSNKSDQTVEATVKPIKPFGERKKLKWATPVPDLSWVKVEPDLLKLGPGVTGEADVKIAVPKDPAFAGKQYEVWLLAETVGGQFGVGLITRVRFNTVLVPPATKETDTEKKTDSAPPGKEPEQDQGTANGKKDTE
jgi:hypothetical protein